jgi:hypothetical protein
MFRRDSGCGVSAVCFRLLLDDHFHPAILGSSYSRGIACNGGYLAMTGSGEVGHTAIP